MSGKREKKRRRWARYDYHYALDLWRRSEPPWWWFISHWLWKKEKPKKPKGVR